MKVLVACEESQRVCEAFRVRGHEAYSCDIIDCSGGHPEWHIKHDVLDVINPHLSDDGNEIIEFTTCDGVLHSFEGTWDLIIAHPPCTYLTVTGNRWFNIEKYGEKAIQRHKDRDAAADFFMKLANANCPRIAIENPVGVMSTRWRKPDQIIQPYWFGDPFEKKTCLWLKGLPKLVETNRVEPEKRIEYASGKTMPAWYAQCWSMNKEERSKARSKTFPGFANAMAEQWGDGEIDR